MKCKIINVNKDIVYRITDTQGTPENVLNSMYYLKNGVFFEKHLPLDVMMFEQNFKEIEQRYNLFINRELENRYSQKCLEQALLWICEIHKEHNICWWLAGSTALYIRGIDVRPHDLDIMTYLSQKDKIKEAVSHFIVEPFHHVSSWVVKGFGVIDKGVRVDYAFEPESFADNDGFVDFGPYAESHLEKVIWNGYEILVPPVELHLKSNLARNRMDTVQKIQVYMDEKRGNR